MKHDEERPEGQRSVEYRHLQEAFTERRSLKNVEGNPRRMEVLNRGRILSENMNKVSITSRMGALAESRSVASVLGLS